MTSMPAAAAKILADALALPPAERGELAHALLRSLAEDDSDDPSTEAAWAAELERRADSVAQGTAELVPWDEARAKLRADLKARREARGR
jgi:putative addiction module component (TIGR02574 family)